MSDAQQTDSLWSLGTLTDDEGATLVRYRGLPASGDRNLWPKQFVIEWEFRSPRPDGWPTSEEHQETKVFENAVVKELEKGRHAFLALVTTGNGYREWYFYCGDPIELQGRLNRVLRGQSFPIQLHVGDDPSWDVYDEFVSPFLEAR